MRTLLARIALWRARIAETLNGIPAWRELTEFCRGLTLPLTALARATLRLLPFLRRLEWLLEIEALARRHPVVLVFTLAFVLLRGLKPTPLGHIATDKAIYPFIALVSGYNPFLGMLCGAAYGIGDLVQKFFLPDIYGARHWTDLNFWGAMAGYMVAYSSLMLMGLAPGMASRACRAAVAAAVRSWFRRRAAALADGADPLAASPAPLLELAAAAAGAYAAGWTVMHEVAPVTERPAFYWRPQPDVSCHRLEVETHLQQPAPAVGAVAAGGAAIPVLAPPPPPPGAALAGAAAGADLPEEIEWVAPDGKRHVLVRNADGRYINILTGGEVDPSRLEEWKQSWSSIIADHQQFSREQMEKLAARDTAFDRALDAIRADHETKQKILDNLSQMERSILLGTGPEAGLFRAPGQPGNVLEHIHGLRQQLLSGQPVDQERYEKVLRVWRAAKRGDILSEDSLPSASELWRDVVSETFRNTAREFVTGQTADGGVSWLGLAGRTLTAALTGGASEFVFTPAEALQKMKDYVDQGGDSVLGGFASSAGAVLTGELVGRAGQLAGSALGRAAQAGGELLEEAARGGSRQAQAVLDAIRSANRSLDDMARSVRETFLGKPPSTSVEIHRPAVPPANPARDAARAGAGQSMKFIPADVPVEKLASGYSREAVRQAERVSKKYNVILDMRPTNPASRAHIESGAAVPKRSFVKNKTLTEKDLLLGAKGQPGLVGHYNPKLPPKGDMSDAEYRELQRLFDQRRREYIEESSQILRLKQQGKIQVRDGVIYDAASGKPMAGDIDLFDIRDARTGRPLPRYMTDSSGNLIYDPRTGQPRLHPLREQILVELRNGPFQAQHGAHMDWKYDHLPTSAHDARIDAGVLGKHQKGGEPLVSIGPGGASATYIEGGR